jgi:outer membrane lipoprotein-sorting protein
MTQIGKRWVPAIAISAVIAGVALVAPLAANASASLPDKSPAEVLEFVQQNRVSALSGTIEQKADLGIPAIPSGLTASNAGLASALELLTGTHRARVFLNGPSQARVQVLDRLGERDAIRNGNDVWLYSSDKHTATHVTLPDKAAAPHAPALTPAQLAQRFLAAIDPSTTVTVGRDVTVAGRSAYNLVLTPRTSDTLVGSVSIAVDGRTGLPLGVTVKARGQEDPALSVAFTSLTIGAPDAGLFSFTPPKGATVKEHVVKEHAVKPPSRLPHGTAHPAVTGSGWASIAEVPASKLPANVTGSRLLGELSTSVDGGRLFHTSLVNILLTPDGRAFVGSVPAAALQAAAASE